MGPPQLRNDAFFVLPGIELGGLGSEDISTFRLGGELSLVYFMPARADYLWFGGYGDAAWAASSDGLIAGGGLELGWFLFGIEAGYIGLANPGEAHKHGFEINGILTAGVVSLTVGGGALDGDYFGALTALVKLPISFSERGVDVGIDL